MFYCHCGDFKEWNKTDFWRADRKIVFFKVTTIQRAAASDGETQKHKIIV